MKNDHRRAVITGMGVISPIGNTVGEYWSNLVSGRSGIGPITLCDATPFPCQVAGEVNDFDPTQYMEVKDAKRMARFSQLAVAAARLAIEDSGLETANTNEERMGVVIGNGNGGFPTTEDNARVLSERGGMKVSPYFIPMVLPNMAAANVSRIFGLKGYSSTVITACAAGTQGVGEAAEVIKRGVADVVLGGGTEAGSCQLGLGGFNVIKALSSKRNDKPESASRPFDAERDGFVPSEGAGILVIESLDHAKSRGANILAEVISLGVSSDAYHAVQPDEDGGGAARAMRFALEGAKIGPADVDYITAHGTSTPKNDISETHAIKTVFGEKAYNIPISSTKSMTGHGMGAAGALEAVVCVKTIETGEIHATINYDLPDPECDLDYVPNLSRKQQVDTVISNSFGFGGQNASIVIRRFQE